MIQFVVDRFHIYSHISYNMNLFDNGHLNVAGLMLFGKEKFAGRPFSEIKAISFLGNDTSGDEYRDSQNFQGNLKHLYENGLTFLLGNSLKIHYPLGVHFLTTEYTEHTEQDRVQTTWIASERT
ncbi:MAG: hypothetical protein GY801_13795 [bacterium]|nr:hypothetical protein [bacterium]